MQPNASTANYNLEVLRNFRDVRFQESIQKNPYFTCTCFRRMCGTFLSMHVANLRPDGPFDGMLVSQAAFTFIYRFMANHSAEYPEGRLDKDVLKSFMSISGPEDNLQWKKGYEQIPTNWYRRDSTVDSYTIPYCMSFSQNR